MTLSTYKTIKMTTAMFIAMMVSISIVIDNSILAVAAVIIGMVFLLSVKRQTRGITVDERLVAVGDKAARLTLAIVMPILAVASFVLVMIGRHQGETLAIIGQVVSYLTLGIMAVHSIVITFMNRKLGGEGEE